MYVKVTSLQHSHVTLRQTMSTMYVRRWPPQATQVSSAKESWALLLKSNGLFIDVYYSYRCFNVWHNKAALLNMIFLDSRPNMHTHTPLATQDMNTHTQTHIYTNTSPPTHTHPLPHKTWTHTHTHNACPHTQCMHTHTMHVHTKYTHTMHAHM